MKTEKEIKEFLVKTELSYEEAVKCKQKYLQTVGSSVINALRWVLERAVFTQHVFLHKKAPGVFRGL